MPARTRRRRALPAALLRYQQLSRLSGAVAFYVLSLPPRLGSAMLNIGAVVLVHASTGSYALAGTTSGTIALAGAVGGPLGARLADRYGHRRALLPLLLGYGTGLTTLLAVVDGGGPAGLRYVAAAVTGVCLPPVGSMTRARWAAVTDRRELLDSALALESLTEDLSYVLGPPLATLLAAWVSPTAGLVVTATLVTAGGAGLVLLRGPRVPPAPGGAAVRPLPHRAARRLAGPLAAPGVQVLALAFVGVGVVFSGLSVSVTAFAIRHGQPAAAGPLYSGFGVASMVAGALYGAVRWRAPARRRLMVGFAAVAAGCLTLPAANGFDILAVAIALPGLALAPTIIGGNALVRELAPAGTVTEAFAWLGGAGGIGFAVGSTVTGRIVDTAEARLGFLVPAVAAACSALVIVAARRRLTEPGRDHARPTTSSAMRW